MMNWFKRHKRGFAQVLWCVGTAAASAGVLYVTLPLWAAGILLGIVMVHEFGHYFAALASAGATPELPYFIPLFFFVMGGTHVVGESLNQGRFIALAGPIAGTLAAIAAMVVCWMLGFTAGIWFSAWMLAFQAWALTFGKDGKVYRRFTKDARNERDARPQAAPQPTTVPV